MNKWRIIKSKEDYDTAMTRLLELADTDLNEGSDDFDEFELLSLLIGHYEDSNYKMDKPSPIEAIKFRMDQSGLTQADMRQYLGSASKVSEVLAGKRKLSLTMIRRLHDGLGIPADILIQDTDDVEWSSVAFGLESLAIAFSDACNVPPEPVGFAYARQTDMCLGISAEQICWDTSTEVEVKVEVNFDTSQDAIPVYCY
ncbi:helix-turn-helix domain-containing protein [Klebsiella grimontii]|uniref:helix-turn-helix domain-containing protein n=1 Tax=Klebsiella grimontii TaxID=2058152 RepID=UPI003DA416EA